MNVQDKVVETIIKALENGVKPWKCPWEKTGETFPENLSTRAKYRGINVILLWIEQQEKGYSRNFWLTFAQAKKLGGKVKKVLSL